LLHQERACRARKPTAAAVESEPGGAERILVAGIVPSDDGHGLSGAEELRAFQVVVDFFLPQVRQDRLSVMLRPY
jgi:hypothetical protein